ncbi:alkaline phosphatase family protein-like protein [Microthyrium microscopicum]|uniref:Alkaline phosphatase family protein-like protein n=1 Tax=Microthyrium microscopicum TaxID=703497 RepID=A0A6A6US81_9PEZI|nr:alkaline phosphatase family protein-like protein [Microthyrium microscopicum]
MPRTSDVVAGVASTLLRLFSYIFLRWVPGHVFPSIILTLSAIYYTAFFRSFLTTSPFEIISDELDIITRETVSQGYESEEDNSLLEGAEEAPLEEIDVTETITLAQKSPHRLKALLLGIPSPVSLLWSMITSGINLALICMTLDMVYRGPLLYEEHDLVFSRVGFVSYDSAKVLVREPRVEQLPLFLSYRLADKAVESSAWLKPDTAWKHSSQINDLSLDTDYTAAVTIPQLSPNTRYQYTWSNNQTGFFRTAPLPGHPTTTNDGTFTFVFTSCLKARVPYNPFDHPLHIQGLKQLGKLVPSLKAQFMLFMGDFIYIDVPHRFGNDIETYRSEYRRVYASPDWQRATAELPWLHVIDDHEIANDWDKNTTGIWSAAVDPWTHYQAAVNPPAVQDGESYFQFTQGPVSVFMLETRRYRTPESNDALDPAKSMLGQTQLEYLLDWIRAEPPAGVKWKVIVSSVPFTKNWRFGDNDTWGKYLAERRIILEAMWAASLAQGVGMTIISGDRHEAAVTRLVDESGTLPGEVSEFAVSPLNMFYTPTYTYKQKDQEDQQINYTPHGNSKFGALEISSQPNSDQSILKFRLFIDGEETYTHMITSPDKAK